MKGIEKLIRYKTDVRGLRYTDGNGELVTEELFGTVIIVLHPDDEKYYK